MQRDEAGALEDLEIAPTPALPGGLQVVTGPARWRRYPFRVGGGFELCVSRNDTPPQNQLDGRRFAVPDGTLLVVEPGAVWTAEGRDAFRSLEVGPELFAAWWTEALRAKPRFRSPSFEPGVVPGLAPWFEGAHAALAAEVDPLAAEERLAAILETVTTRCTDARMRDPVRAAAPELERVRELLRRESARHLTLEDVARLAGSRVGTFQLVRSFRRRFGVTPHHYQRLVRVAVAHAHLRDGMPIARAALEAGFHDQAHLTRAFRAVYGLPPGRYRRGQSRTRRTRPREANLLP